MFHIYRVIHVMYIAYKVITTSGPSFHQNLSSISNIKSYMYPYQVKYVLGPSFHQNLASEYHIQSYVYPYMYLYQVLYVPYI